MPRRVLAAMQGLAAHAPGAGAMWLAALSVSCLLGGLILLPGPPGLSHVAIAAGAVLSVLALQAGPARDARLQPAAATAHGPIEQRLEKRIEQLQDLQWELRENEARYRNLLDMQDDIILRRDRTGRLTFVNRAFCRTFGVEQGSVLDTSYRPTVLAEGKSPATAGDPLLPPGRFVQQLETAGGPRWFAWEERSVPGVDIAVGEIQAVAHDITEQRRAETELAHARDQAEAANRAKSRFLAAMSHEIRTPMNGILGMSGLLLETPQTPEQQTYTRAIDQSAKTLLALIDEILDFSKIEAGKLRLHEAPFALDTCIQSVVELLGPRAHDKGLELAWTAEPGLPRIFIGDESRVRQILLNLIGNAVKFTDAGGIVVEVAGQGGEGWSREIAISVRDTGIGLAPEAMVNLFAEFEQAGANAGRRQGGTGLGLAISRRLAHAMHGDIRVESELGRGATFTAALRLKAAPGTEPMLPMATVADGAGRALLAFDLAIERRVLSGLLTRSGVVCEAVAPAGAADAIAAAADAGTPVGTVIVDAEASPQAAGACLEGARRAAGKPVRGIVLITANTRRKLREFRAAGFDAYLVRPVRPRSLLAQLGADRAGKVGAMPAPHAAATQKAIARLDLRILLAEDNAINALLARAMLEKVGCSSVHVPDGSEAVEAMRDTIEGREAAFDLILMDVHMPVLDGFEAVAAIRRLVAETTGGRGVVPPIIALTANAFAEDRKRCLAAGMDDYLAKPFERSELEALLRRWCIDPGSRLGYGIIDETAA